VRIEDLRHGSWYVLREHPSLTLDRPLHFQLDLAYGLSANIAVFTRLPGGGLRTEQLPLAELVPHLEEAERPAGLADTVDPGETAAQMAARRVFGRYGVERRLQPDGLKLVRNGS
jgi:hypothetical protein